MRMHMYMQFGCTGTGYGRYYDASWVRGGSAAGWRAHKGLPTAPDAGACDCMLHTGAHALVVHWGGWRAVRQVWR